MNCSSKRSIHNIRKPKVFKMRISVMTFVSKMLINIVEFDDVRLFDLELKEWQQ